MSRFNCRALVLVASLASLASCAERIAPIRGGESCAVGDDCTGLAVCYRGRCLHPPGCHINGVVESGEECDDNNSVNSDACSNKCLIARCGDGIVRTDFDDDGARWELCEPVIGDPDLECGSDCILRPKPRRMITSSQVSCALADDLTMQCWGRFINYIEVARRLREEGTVSWDSIGQWYGNSVTFRVPMRGFFAVDETWRVISANPDFKTHIIAQALQGNQRVMLMSRHGLALAGTPQGGAGEPRNSDWVSRVAFPSERRCRAYTGGAIGSCFVERTGRLRCFTTAHKDVCADLNFPVRPMELGVYYQPPIPIVADVEGLIGVARAGFTICGFDELGDVYCLGDLARWRPVVLYDNSERLALCTPTEPCEDPERPYCLGYRSAEENGVCVSCLSNAQCGAGGVCEQWRCHHGEVALALSACQSSPPTRMAGLSEIVEIAASGRSYVARNRAGAVFRWGAVVIGAGEDGVARAVREPSQVALPGVATQVSVNEQTACALLVSGEVHCWGRYNGSPDVAPTLIALPLPATELSMSTHFSNHFCVATASGRRFCWGLNDTFQLGDQTREPRSEIVEVAVSFARRD